MEAKKEKINPTEWYSLQDIVRMRMFPWYSSFAYVRKVVVEDYQGRNVLKAVITGKQSGRKYQIKGEHIIKFIKAVESGKVKL